MFNTLRGFGRRIAGAAARLRERIASTAVRTAHSRSTDIAAVESGCPMGGYGSLVMPGRATRGRSNPHTSNTSNP